MKKSISIKPANHELITRRLTAMWAFSEAAIGGVLHAFRPPFKGIIIAGFAIVFISLIGYYSEKRGTILKSTFIVLIVKGIVSPHASLTAFAAVLFQGLIGELIFSLKRFIRYLPIFFGMIVLTTSALQKFLILTIVFGNTFWTSIDRLAETVYTNIFTDPISTLPSLSLIIIFIYTAIHIIAGFFIGKLSSGLPSKIDEMLVDRESFSINSKKETNTFLLNGRKKKSWWKKPSRIMLLLIITGILTTSFLIDELKGEIYFDVLIMTIRAVIFLMIWYFFLSPLILKGFQLILKKKESEYLSDVEEVMDIFPAMKIIVAQSFNDAKDYHGFKKFRFFLSRTFSLALTAQLVNNNHQLKE